MKITTLELGLIAGTRAMLGIGIGLLAADKLSDDRRRVIGKLLLGIGAASTIPLAFEIFRRRRSHGEIDRRDVIQGVQGRV